MRSARCRCSTASRALPPVSPWSNAGSAVLTRDSLMLVLQDEAKLGNKILLKLVQLLSERLRQTSAKLVSYLEAARDA